jgi:hypothetical protein
MVAPKWVRTCCQPIAIRDVLVYLVGVLGNEAATGRILEIGGPDVSTYNGLMDVYAEVAGLKRRRVIPVPLLTPSLSSHWIGLVTPIPSGLARPLVESLTNEVVVRDHAIESIVPHTPMPFRRSIELALERMRELEVATTWAGAELAGRSPADPMPTDPSWSGGVVLTDVKQVHADAPPSAVYATVTGIGGTRGWYVTELLWSVRGVIDQLMGGPGMRRGRRHPDDLRVGDPVDFWRVEELVPDTLMRLRAEMHVPGRAWLEYSIAPEGDGSRLIQSARFHPRGLGGRLYWYSLLPFHALIFGRLAARLAAAAEGREPPTGPVGDAIRRRSAEPSGRVG